MALGLRELNERIKELDESIATARAKVKTLTAERKGLDDARRALRGDAPRPPVGHGKLIARALSLLGVHKHLKTRAIAEKVLEQGYPYNKAHLSPQERLTSFINNVGTVMRQRPDLFAWDGDTEEWKKATSSPAKPRPT